LIKNPTQNKNNVITGTLIARRPIMINVLPVVKYTYKYRKLYEAQLGNRAS
jgi:hypothetical protein